MQEKNNLSSFISTRISLFVDHQNQISLKLSRTFNDQSHNNYSRTAIF